MARPVVFWPETVIAALILALDRTKIPRLAIVGMVFDGGPCPCKSAAPSRAYSIFGENFCECVGEFAIEHRNVGNLLMGISDFANCRC